MGRIKNQLIKKLAIKFVKINERIDLSDFDNNKILLREYLGEGISKKLINVLSGYVKKLYLRKAHMG